MKTSYKYQKCRSYLGLMLLLFVLQMTAQCTTRTDSEISSDTGEAIDMVSGETWIIDEHTYNDAPLTSKAEKSTDHEDSTIQPQPVETDDTGLNDQEISEQADIAEVDMMEEAYEIVTVDALEEDLLEMEYETMESKVAVTEIAVPLEETQTLVTYAKKDKKDAALQVVSNSQTGEIEQITFIDKKHKDVYDVQAGLSGKEVKQLRKEMKHMIKNGQVFLYDDQSNIMYLMDAKNMVGDEVTAADVETMEVQAIVWKDKKHHKEN